MPLDNYKPQPIDLSDVELPESLRELSELLARNVHEVWATSRIARGWTYGDHRDDTLRQTPCLVDYDSLSEEEKDYDRLTSQQTLKLILKLGYKISKD
ncbi:MAG: RyR domain-containing protein [Muribaculaceae bacterium]|nr:RyR domain-containing protein [Bacteroidales bacterium]MDY2732979.1 RyR domain-containing protein [Muribaculaceae bacterium]MDD6701287.1 RyR domain-containing protein [Bacteroidales bacterium]MDD6942981.1 RyR domain-containing protein [Bacteroidales bacterium]MDY4649083.1 RyR domain-containing protein [Muribaculaceae bacterium]